MTDVLIIALGIAFIIFIHELGHFAVGKFFKFNIEVFSVGFGKDIFSFKRGGTVYQLALIPLGGYVKFKGEMPDERSDDEDGSEGDPYDFQNRPAYQRALVLVAGVTMNVLSGIGMVLVAYLYGVMEPPTDIGGFEHESPAKVAGLRVGDKITKINDAEVDNYYSVVQEAALGQGKDMKVEVIRDGETLPPFTIKPTPPKAGEKPIYGIGVIPRRTNLVAGLAKKSEGDFYATPAEDAKLQEGDIVTGLRLPEGAWVPIEYNDHIEAFLKDKNVKAYLGSNNDKFIDLRYDRQGKEGVVKIKPYAPIVLGFKPKIKRPSLADNVKEWFAGEAEIKTVVHSTIENTPAEKAGLKSGDEIRYAGGELVTDFKKFRKFLAENRTKPFLLNWRTKEGLTKEAMVSPELGEFDLGFGSKLLFKESKFGFSEVGPLVAHASKRTQYEFSNLFRTFQSLFSGSVGTEALGGPIAIVRVSSRALEAGFGFFLIFLAIISFNLALLNILPVPLLDGGQLVLVMIEAIMGRPLNEKVQMGLQYVGMFLLGGLILFVFYNDIFRNGF